MIRNRGWRSFNCDKKENDMPQSSEKAQSRLAFLFDLDGTLVDSVYWHVQAWQEAFRNNDLTIAAWRIHRRIGMSGNLLVRALLRDKGRDVKEEQVKELENLHGEAYARLVEHVTVLPGAREVLQELSRLQLAWAIVTSSKPEKAQPVLKLLNLDSDAVVVTSGEVSRAKPEPDPFYVGAERLGAKISDCVVIGDSVWDLLSAQRARALGVGTLTGGSGRDELERAGAYRVYADPQDLLEHLDELGVQRE
jgi:HAD superfamily hydrolase (TIGR01549 family)